jgi:hypothetical protein
VTEQQLLRMAKRRPAILRHAEEISTRTKAATPKLTRRRVWDTSTSSQTAQRHAKGTRWPPS